MSIPRLEARDHRFAMHYRAMEKFATDTGEPVGAPIAGGSSGEFTVGGVLMMVPQTGVAPVVVLVEGTAPSSLLLDVFSDPRMFVRVRKGAPAHGLREPYRELTEEYPAESVTPAMIVNLTGFVRARFAYSASVFGAADAAVFLPRDAGGQPHRRVRVPVPSLDRASWHEFELLGDSNAECRYRAVVA
ncbi:hypothetical protein GCM10027415_31590 [Humibacter ginsengisoli]